MSETFLDEQNFVNAQKICLGLRVIWYNIIFSFYYYYSLLTNLSWGLAV
jgi:hypothetical protein